MLVACRSAQIHAVMQAHAGFQQGHSAPQHMEETAAQHLASSNPMAHNVEQPVESVTFKNIAQAAQVSALLIYTPEMAQPATVVRPTATLGSAILKHSSARSTLGQVYTHTTTTAPIPQL